MEPDYKLTRLENILKDLGSVAVAFSAGVDSAFLAYTAHRVLGGKMLAVTIDAPSVPRRELHEAQAFCEGLGIRHTVCVADQLSIEGFRTNPTDRCYHCKLELFSAIKRATEQSGAAYVAEGSNVDDLSDFRPGLKAIAELGIKSPLREAGLTKLDIRLLSRAAGLPTWDKPSFACLATRIPYGDEITSENLKMAELAEERLFDLGFKQLRVRIHGTIARIELPKEDIERLLSPALREEIVNYFSSLGFSYTALDLGGFKSGNMNKGREQGTGNR